MRLAASGFVGIGTAAPQQTLHVNGLEVLSTGFGAGFKLRDRGSSSSSDDWVWFSSGNVARLWRSSPGDILGVATNGNVGIGNTNPAFILDVSQRMRLRSGGNNNASAGIHLNNNSNNIAAFMGMEDDTHIGFFGNGGAGWKFGMNTVTGALKVNGTEGRAGQVITSNGSSTAQWKSSTNALYQQTEMNLNSGTISATTATLIPGLSKTVTLSDNAKLLVQLR